MAETGLTLGSIEFPTGSDWGIRQTLDPIDNGQILRTVNGVLVDFSRKIGRKLSSTVSCSNALTAPAIDGLWRGMQITVGCIAGRSANANGTDTITLARPPVNGSVQARDAAGSPLAVVGVSPSGTGAAVSFAGIPAGSVSYRPILTMLVMGVTVEEDEAGAAVSWTIQLEEV